MEEPLNYTNQLFSSNLDYLIGKSNPKLTKKQLDSEIGMAEGYLSRCTREGSEQQPSVHVMKLLADKLHVTIDELIYQDLSKKDKRSYGDILSEKEKQFLKVLIQNTKNSKFIWNKFNLFRDVEDPDIDFSPLFQLMIEDGYPSRTQEFSSMFGNKNSFSGYNNSYFTNIDGNNQVLIVQFVHGNNDEVYLYELYASKSGKVFPCFYGCINKQNSIFTQLNNLWDAIEIDTPRKELMNFYDEIISNNEVKKANEEN